MAIITLTTDYGTKDYFVSALKAKILRELPAAQIVDITHEIAPFNIPETGYILKNAYAYFPDDTIHIVGVDAEYTIRNKHIVVKLNNQYFIGADNGIFSFLTFDNAPNEQVEILFDEQQNSIFPVLDVFVKAAIHIAKAGTLNEIGKPIHQLNTLSQTAANIHSNGNQIIGFAIYIDHFGNVVFNITKKQFETVSKGRKYKISTGSHKYPVNSIYEKYSDIIEYNHLNQPKSFTYEGNAMVVFNSAGYLQVSIYKSNLKTVGGAATLLGLKYGSSIIIDFN